MKRLLLFLILGLGFLPGVSQGSSTAQVTFFCLSLRFSQGEDSFGSTLDFSTVAGTPNGEMAAWYSTYTHRSSFSLDYIGLPITGQFYLDLPPFQDADGDGFDDSYETSQAISGTSTGEYTTSIGGGTVTATWYRDAGSKSGTCRLQLIDDTYGDLGTFNHTFEILEYKGTINYAPGATNVSGDLNLTNDSDQIQGSVDFEKSANNPYNLLTLPDVAWTNASAQTFSLYSPTSLKRDTTLETNYYGRVDLMDGDLNTADDDYYTWEISIDDPNDSDHDTIPNFSDDPQTTLPRQPVLSLAQNGANFQLTVSGDIGHVCHILEASSLTSPNWTTNQTFTLTSDPQTVSLPLAAGMTKFWRVQTE